MPNMHTPLILEPWFVLLESVPFSSELTSGCMYSAIAAFPSTISQVFHAFNPLKKVYLRNNFTLISGLHKDYYLLELIWRKLMLSIWNKLRESLGLMLKTKRLALKNPIERYLNRKLLKVRECDLATCMGSLKSSLRVWRHAVIRWEE